MSAQALVPGDVIRLEEGDAIPADARLLEASELRVLESALTGESVAVEKEGSREVPAEVPLPDRTNMLFMGTTVVGGSADAVVVETGGRTELGRIGQLVGALPEERTPLERKLDALGGRLVWVTLAASAALVVLGIWRGAGAGTGTHAAAADAHPALAELFLAAALSARAQLREASGAWTAIGDPTDAALLVLASKFISAAQIRQQTRVVRELPFSSARRYSAVFTEHADTGAVVFVKGAPAQVLALCATVHATSGVRANTDDDRARLRETNDRFAADGLRVIALATERTRAGKTQSEPLRDLTFLGVVGMQDPAAPGVAETIDALLRAGIRTIMLTGDQRLTAEAIARQLRLCEAGDAARAGTVAFMTLALAQAFHLGNARRISHVLSPRRIVSNPAALGALALVLCLQAAALYVAPLREVLKTVPLSAPDLLFCLVLSVMPAFFG